MIVYIAVGIIAFLTVGYFLLMFFFPEWVGISGEDTRRAVEAHREEAAENASDETNVGAEKSD